MSILTWEKVGFVVIVILGTIWHFVFQWSGGWPPLAFIFPVNESVWEHLKLAFWPSLLFALIEYPFLHDRVVNFWPAKIFAAVIGPLVIAVGFYLYTSLLGTNYFVLDILLFITAVAFSQYVSYQLLTGNQLAPQWTIWSWGLLAVALAAFLTLTFHPFPADIFVDHHMGSSGIPR